MEFPRCVSQHATSGLCKSQEILFEKKSSIIKYLYEELNRFWYQFQCGQGRRGSSLDQQAILRAPAGSSTIQVNSIWDSIRFHRLRVQSYKTAPTPPQLLQTSFASPGCYLCFWPTQYILEVPKTSLDFRCQIEIQIVSCTSVTNWL